MIKNKSILLPAFYFVVGVGFIEVIQRYNIVKFLNSGFFIAVVTFVVGFSAIYLYKKQQSDNKRDAAKLIIQEIRYAEQQVRNVRMLSISEPNYYMGYTLLPTNSWHKNINLFVNDLSENQIDLISNFYSQAAYLDELIKIISNEKNKIWNGIENIVLANGNVLVKNHVVLPNGFNVPDNQIYHLQTNQALADVTNRIEFIYNSPAVDKLRAITEKN
jgi:hypothetical protein